MKKTAECNRKAEIKTEKMLKKKPSMMNYGKINKWSLGEKTREWNKRKDRK